MKRTKKQYESPQMEVFELKHHPQLLAGSSGDGGLQDYDWNNEDE